jgi:hypothetical protein
VPQPAEVHQLADPTVQAYLDAWDRILVKQATLQLDPLSSTQLRRLREMQAAIESIVAGLDAGAAGQLKSKLLPPIYAAGGAAGAAQ